MQSETSLKSCPFCGCNLRKHALSDSWHHPDGLYATCPCAGFTVTEIEKWNTRAPSVDMEKLIAEIEALGEHIGAPHTYKIVHLDKVLAILTHHLSGNKGASK